MNVLGPIRLLETLETDFASEAKSLAELETRTKMHASLSSKSTQDPSKITVEKRNSVRHYALDLLIAQQKYVIDSKLPLYSLEWA